MPKRSLYWVWVRVWTEQQRVWQVLALSRSERLAQASSGSSEMYWKPPAQVQRREQIAT